jgi:hypothetical protein
MYQSLSDIHKKPVGTLAYGSNEIKEVKALPKKPSPMGVYWVYPYDWDDV